MRKQTAQTMSGLSVIVVAISLIDSNRHEAARLTVQPAGVLTSGAPSHTAVITRAARRVAPRTRTTSAPTSSVAPASQTLTAVRAPVAATTSRGRASLSAQLPPTRASAPKRAPVRTAPAAPTGAPMTTTAAAPTSTTVNGAAEDTPYGPVQVQITLSGGRITQADAIVYPQGTGRDQQINSRAIPQLNSETLQAQSAQINSVSGASYTSDAYIRSLQSALDSAHA
jgi:uncharacterized protein with FMN-binding domain